MRRLRILVQCSIPFRADDWHVGRFSSLVKTLRGLRDGDGEPLTDVLARNRSQEDGGHDPVLASLSRSTFDEVWLLGVDGGDGLGELECAAIDAFQHEGGGVLATRDHQNMGLWLRRLRGVGAAHHFNREDCREADPSRWCRDDVDTRSIDFPNYHSGANGEPQRIEPVEPLHPLLLRPDGSSIEFLPAHPHEGAVAAPPEDERARMVARGRSQLTGRSFNLLVAFERGGEFRGRGVADSSFHHFADYNWDPAAGAPSFVTEPPAAGLGQYPRALEEVETYVENLARWLAPGD
jgi:hypothetical protein